MKIYTRTGDAGTTALFGGGRAPKDHVRIRAYGDVDELNSAIGVAAATDPVDLYAKLLVGIQKSLFAIGGQLATPDPDRVQAALEKARVDDSLIESLEAVIDEVEDQLEPLSSFIVPGGTMKAAQFHMARTVCRRAERSVVTLANEAPVPDIILKYLNRLSDLLFSLARLANRRAEQPDVQW